jgi:uncharacterized membrane protein YphA (DoxX/SURF4 family)
MLARARVIALWGLSVVTSLGIGLAGVTKFPVPNHWQEQFLAWGYPYWFVFAVGAAEVVGAIALFLPRFALLGVGLLLVVMIGALITLIGHPGSSLGGGATPAFYVGVLCVIGLLRWRLRARNTDATRA